MRLFDLWLNCPSYRYERHDRWPAGDSTVEAEPAPSAALSLATTVAVNVGAGLLASWWVPR
jgi:hypothetical protein